MSFGKPPPKKGRISKDTENLLSQMMAETGIDPVQQRKLKQAANKRGALPASRPKEYYAEVSRGPAPRAREIKRVPVGPRSNTRSKASIEASNAYAREQYRPTPTKNMAAEKTRYLAHLDAKRQPPKKEKAPVVEDMPTGPPLDAFDELLAEIDERREFLRDMVALGNTEHDARIRAEINQRIRKLKAMDPARTQEAGLTPEIVVPSDSKRMQNLLAGEGDSNK